MDIGSPGSPGIAGEGPMGINHAVEFMDIVSLGAPSEERTEINHVDMDRQIEQIHDASEPSSPSSLDHTGSQVHKPGKVQNALQRLDDMNEPMQRLKEKVSRLVVRIGKKGAHLEEEKRVLDDCQKLARSLGEDLLEGVMALDELSGLCAEDRSNRKVAIARSEGFLEEADKIKSDLVTMRNDLDAKLEAKHAARNEQSDLQADLSRRVLKLRRTSTAENLHSDEVIAPERMFWEQLELPLDFTSEEDRTCRRCEMLSCVSLGVAHPIQRRCMHCTLR